jgi:hypothetical protein
MKFLKPEAEDFLKKALGTEGFEELSKVELHKLSTNTTLDHQEVATALQIVPRTILSLLQKELSSMQEGSNKTIDLPVSPVSKMDVTKFSNDVYSGEIYRDGKVLARFKYRSLPGVGLVIMTTFELYEKEDIPKMKPEQASLQINDIQKIIDDRLGLQMMVRQVVDQRLSEREAVDFLIKAKLTQMINESSKEEKPKEQKQFKLKDFLSSRSKKLEKNEVIVKFETLEKTECPDCGKNLFEGNQFSGCVCLGDDRDNKILIKKTENGVKLKFPKTFDPENMQMLLEILKKRNRG